MARQRKDSDKVKEIIQKSNSVGELLEGFGQGFDDKMLYYTPLISKRVHAIAAGAANICNIRPETVIAIATIMKLLDPRYEYRKLVKEWQATKSIEPLYLGKIRINVSDLKNPEVLDRMADPQFLKKIQRDLRRDKDNAKGVR